MSGRPILQRLPRRRTGGRIERLVARIVFLEFSIIAAICFLTSTFYFYAVLTVTPFSFEYLSAALLIALLIVLLSLGFKQYVAIQAQPRDRFMLSGLGAVALGFSLFLSCLFLFKIGDWYSRGTFFSQFLGLRLRCCLCAGGTQPCPPRDTIRLIRGTQGRPCRRRQI